MHVFLLDLLVGADVDVDPFCLVVVVAAAAADAATASLVSVFVVLLLSFFLHSFRASFRS